MAKAVKEPTIDSLVITNLTPSKSNIDTLSTKVAALVQSGKVDPLKAYTRLKAIEEMAKQSQEKIKLDVLFELAKYKGKAEIEGSTISSKESGVRYDYSMNEAWLNLKAQIDELDKQKKAIEEVMKKIPAGKVIVDEQTGETWQGANKSSTTVPEVRLAK